MVLTPQDRAVGDHGTSVEGLPVCSDGQIYIDLVAAGADYAEQAEAFRPLAARGTMPPIIAQARLGPRPRRG